MSEKPDEKEGRDSHRAMVEIPCYSIREYAEEALMPKLDDDGFTWLLPFVPKKGSDVGIVQDRRGFLETGLRLNLPPGVVGRISHMWARARAGMLIPALEIDHRQNLGKNKKGAAVGVPELIVPVTNLMREPLVIHPGEYFASLRFEAIGHGLIHASMVEWEDDEEDDE